MSIVVLTAEQLAETLDWWRPYLGLSDWEIWLSLVPGQDIDALATSMTKLAFRELTIQIATYETRTPISRERCDMEVDLLHELLHAVNNPAELALDLDGNTPEGKLIVEQPIELLARSMVRLRRLSGPRFSWEHQDPVEEAIS
ncbi:hypothetical protein M0R72_09055 [Candidatus Pacearchaeota archaeon]|jgi:hypothetical protein|nr:hypothetical protein [Candidatus Pacearchaeota archaeon]